MPVVGQLKVELTAETVKFSRPVQDASRDLEALGKKAQEAGSNLEKLGNRAAQIGRTLSLSVTAPLAAIGGAAVKMAMDAVESENLFEVSMGKMADAARKWSEELRQQLGLNAYEVRKQVGTFNVMFTSMGLGEQAAYGMSTALTKLAYDMASLYNLKPEDAFLKLQAAISGEIEPLRRLGIVLTETTIEAYALKTGLMKKGEQLSETGKILARYGAIMEQTQKAQGDLARTIESPTNQLRILQSEAKQVAIDFGMALLPAFQDALKAARPLVDKVKELVAWFTALPPSTQQTIVKIAALAAAAGPAALALSGIEKIAAILLGGLGGLATGAGKVAFALGAWQGGAATAAEALKFLFGAFGPFLVGGAVVAGLTLIVGLFAKIQEQARIAGIEIAKISTISEAVKAKEYWAAEVERLERLAAKVGVRTKEPSAAAWGFMAGAIGSPGFGAPNPEAAFGVSAAELENAKKKLAEATKKLEELTKAAGSQSGYEPPPWLKDLLAALSGTGLTTTGKDVRTVADVLEDMNAALAQAAEKEKLLGDAFDLNAEKANIFSRAIDELIKLGVKADDTLLKDIRDRWRSIVAPPKVDDSAYQLGFRLTRQLHDMERQWQEEQWQAQAEQREADYQLGFRLTRQLHEMDRAWQDEQWRAQAEAQEAAYQLGFQLTRQLHEMDRAWQEEQWKAQTEGQEAQYQLGFRLTRQLHDMERQWQEEQWKAQAEEAEAQYQLGFQLTRRFHDMERQWQEEQWKAQAEAQEAAYQLGFKLTRQLHEMDRQWQAEREKEIEDQYQLGFRLTRQLHDMERQWQEEQWQKEAEAQETSYQLGFKLTRQLHEMDRAWQAEKLREMEEQYQLSIKMVGLFHARERAWQASVTVGARLGIDVGAISAALEGGGIDLSPILEAIEKQWATAKLQIAAGVGESGSLLTLQADAIKAAINTLIDSMLKEGMTYEQITAAIAPLVGKLKELKDAIWRVQATAQLASSLLSGLADGLAEAGNAWTDFLSVVVSSIKLATDDAGNIIGVDWKQTLINIANYGLRRLGEAIADLFGGAERLRKQYPGGAYGEVNYPNLAEMRRNYENWEENFQALQRAQQAQAGMTVGGGLIGGFLGFLIGGPLGALIGAGLGAGVGYAAGQAAYGQTIEDLKKKLEDTFQKIAETLGTSISDVAGALGDAFSADTYQEFLSGFATNLESVVKQGLIKAFMAGEAMRPLLQGLSDFITTAVWDGTLDAAEKLQLAQKFQEIVGVAQPFWEALQEFDFTEAVGGATDALNEFSEALRNVPTGYKIQAARWDVALPAYQEGGVVGRTGVAVLHAGETVVPAGESGGIHIHLEGAHIYGMDDFERKVEAAVSKAARRAGLSYRGLARAGA